MAMRGIDFIVFFCLLLLALSFALPTPSGFIDVKNQAERISCAKPACIITLSELSAIDSEFSGKAEKIVNTRGDEWSALALRAAGGDFEGSENFSSRIDALLAGFPYLNKSKDENALIAIEFARRSSENPADFNLSAKAEEARKWVEERPSESFVYLFLVNEGKWAKQKNFSESAAPELQLVHSYAGFSSGKEMVFFPNSEQSKWASDVEKMFKSEQDAERLSAEVYALAYFYIGRYPGLVFKASAFEVAFAYSLPVALICLIPLVTFFTVRGEDKRSKFQRERAANILFCGLLVPVLVVFFSNLIASIPSAPASILLVFSIPLIGPLFLYAIVSMRTQRDYGVIDAMSPTVVVERAKKLLWVTAAGALFTLILFIALTNIQKITAPLKGPIGEIAVPAIFIAMILAVVPFLPRLMELATGSFEVKNEEVKRRLGELAAKFGYSAESIRIVPSAGSSFTNAFQAGIIGRDVKIFVFENLLDENKFTPRELEAVVAHELAHIQQKHVLKSVIGYVCIYLFTLLVFALPLLLVAKGENKALDVFLSAAPYVSLLLAFLGTLWIRRRFEFEADAVAAKMGYGQELLSALKKIYEMNLMPTERPKLLGWFASHGELKERIKRLN